MLDGSAADGRVALVRARDGQPMLIASADLAGRGGAERSAGQLQALLADAGWSMASVELIAVIVGPGSFTGLRATLALAHGLSLGSGCRLIGVRLGEALRRTAGAQTLPVWCATQARRDRIFLDRDQDGPVGYRLDALPRPDHGPVLLAGDASDTVAELLAAGGVAARVLGVEHADACAIAGVALDRLDGRLSPLDAQPLYVDPPEARLSVRGLRPAPA